MKPIQRINFIWCTAIICLLFSNKTQAQSLLDKSISIDVKKQPISSVLQTISRKGDFYFAYNSSIINSDSLVSVTVSNKPVKQVLDLLLSNNYEYSVTGKYIIIKRAPLRLKVITNKAIPEDKIYIITGFVIDDVTGLKVSDASIYEKQRLAATLTNANGYFKLKLKSKYPKAALSVSKVDYEDTTIIIQPKYNQEITITIVPVEKPEETITISPYTSSPMPDTLRIQSQNDSAAYEYTYKKIDSAKVESTPFGRFFSTYSQKIQSLNLDKFIADRPYQISITPGLSTHGKLSAQVVNNASLNIFGGYTAGVRGGEVGGLFNMNKHNMQGGQAAGLFNLTGGYVTGAQAAGLYNLVLESVYGAQVAGITNTIRGQLNGVQVSGIYSHAGNWVKGVQVSGISSFAGRSVNGAQVSGIANITAQTMNGLQISGIVNYAKKLRGVQIGLINIADTSEGYSIGLINIVMKGYHKLSLSYNEVMPLNAAFKTGNNRLYSILLGGINPEQNQKIYSFGYGLGSQVLLTNMLSINPEITSQYLYQGSWDYLNLLNKFTLNVNVKINKFISVFAGPSFNAFYNEQKTAIPGYKLAVAEKYHTFKIGDGNTLKGWLGWNAGINLF